MKRILTTNTAADGNLNIDSAARALLLHRNTPVYVIGQSPASMLFGKPLRDHLPSAPQRMREEWTMLADAREKPMAKRHVRCRASYDSHAKQLPQLTIGDYVAVQNQHGNNPKRWSSTGRVVELDARHKQYRVRIDGSRRATVRNRRFLRRIDPVCRSPRVPMQNTSDGAKDVMTPIQVGAESMARQEAARDIQSTPEGRAISMPRCRLFDAAEPTTDMPARYSDIVQRSQEPKERQQGSPEIAASPVPMEASQGRRKFGELIPAGVAAERRRGSRIRKPAQVFSPKLTGQCPLPACVAMGIRIAERT